jgi:hypothetical protein
MRSECSRALHAARTGLVVSLKRVAPWLGATLRLSYRARSTAAYAVWVVNDWKMASVFLLNATCCLAILTLTAWKRMVFKAAQRLITGAGGQEHSFLPARREPTDREPRGPNQGPYQVVQGGKRRWLPTPDGVATSPRGFPAGHGTRR